MPCELQASRDGAALVLTIAHPGHHNRLDAQACVAAIEALNTADSDEAVRAVVLRGHGGLFCGGAMPDTGRALGDLLEGLATYPKPVLAAVEGEAAGAGWALALAADAVIAADVAAFRLGEALPGLVHQLAQALPRALAWTALWRGQALGAETLHGAGLVTRLVPGGEAYAAALAEMDWLAGVDAEALGERKAAMRRRPPAPWLI